MENWEAAKLATWAESVRQYDLTRSWRFTPGIFFGDSGSVNYKECAKHGDRCEGRRACTPDSVSRSDRRHCA
eukprot:2465554-Lingulodinium_polyedra.AAC.1